MGKGQFAELTAGLLARKGEAMPAAAGFAAHNVVSTRFGAEKEVSKSLPKEAEAGVIDRPLTAEERNVSEPNFDTGQEMSQLSPRDAQAYLEGKLRADTASVFEELECDHLPRVRKTGSPKKRAAVTLRLNTTQYLCLKMAGAKLRRTNQDILVDALDMYLASLADGELKDCTCLQKLIKEELSMK